MDNEKDDDANRVRDDRTGGRPIVQFLPHRIEAKSVEVLEGADLKPLVTERFILVPNPGKGEPNGT